MNFESAFQIILILSSLAILGLIFKKLPVLAGLPLVSQVKLGKKSVFQRLAEKIKTLPFLKNFSFEFFLQKTLSRIRILIMKAENKIFTWLSLLRKRAQENHEKKDDNYWEELKKAKSEKRKT